MRVWLLFTFGGLFSLGLLSACQGVIGDSDPSITDLNPIDTPPSTRRPVPSQAAPGSIRRLSVGEYRASLEGVVGFVPGEADGLPPDSADFGFERTVDSQTISEFHLEGYRQVTNAVVSRLLGEGALSDLVAECPANALPSLSESMSTMLPATVFSVDPDWGIATEDVEPGVVRWIYGEPRTHTTLFDFPTSGRYRVILDADASRDTATLALVVDGANVETRPFQTRQDQVFELDLEAGSHRFEFIVDGEAGYTNFYSLTIEGPIDGDSVDHEALSGCIEGVISTLAPRAFRRPLTASDAERLRSLARAPSTEDNLGVGLRMVLEAILQHPRFLYLVEVGEPIEGRPNYYALDDHELAQRLSYSVCEEPPDEALREAADAGLLQDPGVFEEHARRLFALPCARHTTEDFFEQWLELEELGRAARDLERYPAFSPELADAMRTELLRFLVEMTWTNDANVGDLYTSPQAWLDPLTAGVYGVEARGEAQALPAERSGLLTRAGFLTLHAGFRDSAPVRRGAFILTDLLCQTLPAPPQDVDLVPPEADDTLTTRERWARHSSDERCMGCHELIDPTGFTLEGFDAIGEYRTDENGSTIDTSGGITMLGIEDGALNGGVELGAAVAAAPESRACFVEKWTQFALGRLPGAADGETLSDLVDSLEGEATIRDVMLELVLSEGFRVRVTQEEEGE